MLKGIAEICKTNGWLIAGLACVWACFHVNPYYPYSLAAEPGNASLVELSNRHLTFALIVLASLLVVVLLRKGRAVFAPPIHVGIGVAAGIAGAVLMVLQPQNAWLLTALFIFPGFALAWFGADLAQRCTRLAPNAIPTVLLLSYAAFSIVWLLCQAASAVAVKVVLCACPVIAALCCIMDGRVQPAEGAASPEAITFRDSLAKLPGGILVVGCLSVFFGVICVRVFTAMGQGATHTGGLASVVYVITAALGFVLSIVLLALFAKNRYSGTTVLTALGILALAYLAAFLLIMLLDGTSAQVFAKRLLVAAEHCFEVAMLAIVLAEIARQRLQPTPLVAATFVVILVLPQVIALDLLARIGALSAMTAFNYTAPICAGATFLIAAGLMLMLLRAVKETAKSATQSIDDWQQALVSRAVAGKGITAREEEVVLLMYRGLSAKKAAEELFVSEATVKAHLQRVYDKLDVHTKQDLIALINSYR